MKAYAQIDENGIVTGISSLADEVEAENLIAIETMDESLIGRKFNASENRFDVRYDIPAGEVPVIITLADVNDKLDQILDLLKKA